MELYFLDHQNLDGPGLLFVYSEKKFLKLVVNQLVFYLCVINFLKHSQEAVKLFHYFSTDFY